MYLSYDGNSGEIKPHVRLRYLRDRSCPHYGVTHLGDPVFRRVTL